MCLLQTTFPKVKKQNKIQTNWFVWNWKCFSLWVAFREKISRVVSSHSEENVGRRKMQILHTCMDNSKKIVTNHVNAWVTHVLLLAVSSYQKNVPELPTSNKTFTGWLFYINKPKRWNTKSQTFWVFRYLDIWKITTQYNSFELVLVTVFIQILLIVLVMCQ